MTRATGRLLIVWVALMALLSLTIAATLLGLGPAAPFISYGIALTKAGLILWFFMDLRKDRGTERLAGFSAFAWAAILFVFLAADYLTRSAFASS